MECKGKSISRRPDGLIDYVHAIQIFDFQNTWIPCTQNYNMINQFYYLALELSIGFDVFN